RQTRRRQPVEGRAQTAAALLQSTSKAPDLAHSPICQLLKLCSPTIYRSFCRVFTWSGAAEYNDGLLMEGLRKHIDQMQLIDFVAEVYQSLQIPRQGHRIARDIDDLLGLHPAQQPTHLRSHTGSGRVHHHQLGPFPLHHSAAQKFYSRRCNGTSAAAFEGLYEIVRGS